MGRIVSRITVYVAADKTVLGDPEIGHFKGQRGVCYNISIDVEKVRNGMKQEDSEIKQSQQQYVTDIAEGRYKLLDLYQRATGGSGIKRKVDDIRQDGRSLLGLLGDIPN